ncbi:MAG: hypothetical protein ACI8XZ_000341 [Gammaproteobacteria bacterium]|jgi:hypothetical protein
MSQLVGCDRDREDAAPVLFSGRECVFKFYRFFQPKGFGERLPSVGQRIALVGCKACSSFSASCFYNSTSRFGCHSRTEPVRACAPYPTGLKCSFHDLNGVIFCFCVKGSEYPRARDCTLKTLLVSI